MADPAELSAEAEAPEAPPAAAAAIETPHLALEASAAEQDDVKDHAPASSSEKTRPRQNFSWQQLSMLEQVFDQDPLPKLVRRSTATTTTVPTAPLPTTTATTTILAHTTTYY